MASTAPLITSEPTASDQTPVPQKSTSCNSINARNITRSVIYTALAPVVCLTSFVCGSCYCRLTTFKGSSSMAGMVVDYDRDKKTYSSHTYTGLTYPTNSDYWLKWRERDQRAASEAKENMITNCFRGNSAFFYQLEPYDCLVKTTTDESGHVTVLEKNRCFLSINHEAKRARREEEGITVEKCC